MLADRDCPAVCAFRAVTAHISAAQRMGRDLTAGHLSPVVTAEGGRSIQPLSAARMTTALQGHFAAGRAAEPLHGALLPRGRFPQQSLAGTAVEEIMKIGGCETESVAKYYIGATSGEKVHGSKRKRGQSYATASELPLSP